ncbi:MAG: c-type cytochrome [Planctomycetes bacterium]|nr:c-type cytochrome [Planctomycetota bacterium]
MADKKKKRSLVKRGAIFLGVGFLAVGTVGFGSVYFLSQSKLGEKFERKVAGIEIPEGDEDAVDRGKYLANNVMGCSSSDCHRPDLGGGAVIDAQPMGRVYAPNLTGGEGSVTKEYGPEDWARILRHGLKKDGTRALIMPSEDYVNFSDGDIGAVIAYVKSMPDVDRESIGHSLGPVTRLLISSGELQFAYDKIDHDAKRPEAEPGPTREWGEVLIGTCTGCHGKTLSGGKIPGGDPKWPPARNLTPDESGIKSWTFEDFQKAIKTGTRPDGTTLDPVMPYKAYAGMKPDDIKALWAYLQTVPAKPAGGR